MASRGSLSLLRGRARPATAPPTRVVAVTRARRVIVRSNDAPGSESAGDGAGEESVEMVEARLGVGRKGREMQAKEVKAEPENMSGKAEWKEGELLPEGWDEMDTGKKIIEGLYGKRGFVYWLNWLSFRFIFVLLGGWIVFRFVGPAINAYQLTNDFSASDIQPL